MSELNGEGGWVTVEPERWPARGIALRKLRIAPREHFDTNIPGAQK